MTQRRGVFPGSPSPARARVRTEASMRIEVVGSRGPARPRTAPDAGGDVASGLWSRRGERRHPRPRIRRGAARRRAPRAVINCAAWTRVDAAETEEVAAAASTPRPARARRSLSARGILLCHLSTDYVFDGRATSRSTSRGAHPQSAYGRGKLAGEEAVRASLRSHLIVRTAWLYGQDGAQFRADDAAAARERGSLRVVADQWGSPTWTGHLAPALVRLVERGDTWHVPPHQLREHHLVRACQAIVEEAGLRCRWSPCHADYPTARLARRTRCSTIARGRLGEAPLPSWRPGCTPIWRSGATASMSAGW